MRGGGNEPAMMPGPIRAVVLESRSTDGLVHCTVLPYGGTGRPMYGVPVAAGGGPHQGTVWIPAPSSQPISNVVSAADLDGDHVLVSFIGGRASDPIITHALQHPKATYVPPEQSTEIPATGRHPAVADNGAVYRRHAGTVAMIDRRGSLVIDTTDAPETPAGADQSGTEAKANVIVQLATTSRLEVRVGDTVLFVLEDGVVKAGANPTQHALCFEAFKTIWDSHTHPTGFGPSGPPTALSATCKSPGVLVDAS